MPLLVPAPGSEIVLTFITAMRELSLIILLLSPGYMVLTRVIIACQERDMAQHSGAATLLPVLIVFAIGLLAHVLSGARVFRDRTANWIIYRP